MTSSRHATVPPVTPMLGWLSQQLFGDTLVGLRVLPAAVAAGIVFASAGITAEIADAARRAVALGELIARGA